MRNDVLHTPATVRINHCSQVNIGQPCKRIGLKLLQLITEFLHRRTALKHAYDPTSTRQPHKSNIPKTMVRSKLRVRHATIAATIPATKKLFCSERYS